MYKLTKIVKDYPKGRDVVHALRGVNLEIADGEWLSIQGPTGHGKSTLLQLLGGLDRPTSGSLDLNGQDLARLGRDGSRRSRIRADLIGYRSNSGARRQRRLPHAWRNTANVLT